MAPVIYRAGKQEEEEDVVGNERGAPSVQKKRRKRKKERKKERESEEYNKNLAEGWK